MYETAELRSASSNVLGKGVNQPTFPHDSEWGRECRDLLNWEPTTQTEMAENRGIFIHQNAEKEQCCQLGAAGLFTHLSKSRGSVQKQVVGNHTQVHPVTAE